MNLKLLRMFLLTEFLLTSLLIFIVGAFILLSLLRLSFFLVDMPMYSHYFHQERITELKMLMGCSENVPFLICSDTYFPSHPNDRLDAVNSIKESAPFMHLFPFNIAGIVAGAFFTLLYMLVFFHLKHGNLRKHITSNNYLIGKHKPLNFFVSDLIKKHNHKFFVISDQLNNEPKTYSRFICLPHTIYLDLKLDHTNAQINHAINHELAHAKILWPFESLYTALKYTCVILSFFTIIFAIGFIVFPLVFASWWLSSKYRYYFFEYLADAYANIKSHDFQSNRYNISTTAKWFTLKLIVSFISCSALAFFFVNVSYSSFFGNYISHVITLFAFYIILVIANAGLFFCLFKDKKVSLHD